MQIKTALLVLSLIVNCILVARLVQDSTSDRSVNAVQDSPVTASASTSAAVDSSIPTARDSIADLRRRLSAAGIGDELSKYVILAELNRRFPASVARPDVEYWKPDTADRGRYLLDVENARDRVRDSLVEIFGPDARQDSAFRSVFAPLDFTLPFLDSEQQVAIAKLRLRHRSEPVPAGVNVAGPGGSPLEEIAQARELDRAVAEILSGDDLFEYRLRESGLSKRILLSGVAFTEQEFRDTFRAELAFEANRSSDQFVTYRNDLKNILGRTRYLAYISAQDPGFSAVKSVADKHALRESELLNVYEVMQEAQAGLVEASLAGDAGRSAFVDIIADRDRRMAELVGQQVSAEILQAHSQQMMSLSKSRSISRQ